MKRAGQTSCLTANCFCRVSSSRTHHFTDFGVALLVVQKTDIIRVGGLGKNWEEPQNQADKDQCLEGKPDFLHARKNNVHWYGKLLIKTKIRPYYYVCLITVKTRLFYLHAIIGKMLKIGILGGGQLGRMLLQAAANYPVETCVMENDPECPAAHLCHHFTQGDIRNFKDVYQFGRRLDGMTIEIESVNVEALEKLETEGVKIYPNTLCLAYHPE